METKNKPFEILDKFAQFARNSGLCFKHEGLRFVYEGDAEGLARVLAKISEILSNETPNDAIIFFDFQSSKYEYNVASSFSNLLDEHEVAMLLSEICQADNLLTELIDFENNEFDKNHDFDEFRSILSRYDSNLSEKAKNLYFYELKKPMYDIVFELYYINCDFADIVYEYFSFKTQNSR